MRTTGRILDSSRTNLVDCKGKPVRRGHTLKNDLGWEMTILDVTYSCCVVSRLGLRYKILKESIAAGKWERTS